MLSAEQLLNDPKLRKDLKMGSMRMLVKTLSKYDTEDAKHLSRRLEQSNPVDEIMQQAQVLLKKEGTLTPYKKVNPDRIKSELEIILEPQVSPSDIRYWVNTNRELFKDISLFRLDWLWDFSWAYFMRPNAFGKRSFLVYGAIRGLPPEDIRNVPYQSALNYVRKTRKQTRDRKIFTMAREGNLEGLVEMGFTEEVAKHAIRKVSTVSG